uniref:BTB domain-containing protein n=1 Tax=Strongyloides papillosus TaxID=174720 RepID=A0A0N5BAI9_STREA
MPFKIPQEVREDVSSMEETFEELLGSSSKKRKPLPNDVVFFFENDARYLPFAAVVLVLKSRYFRRHFPNFSKEHYEIFFNNLSFEAMFAMKKFLYSDPETYIMTTKRLLYHMECLGKFDCDSSKLLCQEYIINHLKPKDYFKAFEKSLISDPIFKPMIIEKIVEDFHELVPTCPLNGLSYKTVEAFLGSSIKKMVPHMSLFQLFINWADYHRGMVDVDDIMNLFHCLDIAEFGFGITKEGVIKQGKNLNDYDIMASKFSNLMIDEFKAQLDCKSYYHMTNSLAFVSGGYLHSSDKAFIFNGPFGKVENFLTMPYCRARHTSSVVGKKIFLIGGQDENWQSKKTAFTYDILSQTFTGEFDLLQVARSYHSSVTIDDSIYIIGGYGPTVINTIEIHNLIRDDAIQTQKMPSPEACHDSFLLNNGIYITPGKCNASVRLYDQRAGIINEVCKLQPHIYLSGYCADSVTGEIYSFGGRYLHFRTATSYVYDIRANKFRNICDVEIATPDARCYLYGGFIYVLGGYPLPLPREGSEVFTRYNPSNYIQIYNIRRDTWEVSQAKLVSYTNGYSLATF